MSDIPTGSTQPQSTTRGRGRGRGKSRGGLGKYLRARGTGRGSGRPAEFGKRLLLEGEESTEVDEEETRELAKKYAKRQLGSNADRYVEPEPELDSDGEPIVEPEVDLSSFLEKQRISDDNNLLTAPRGRDEVDEDEVDHTLTHITSTRAPTAASRKGRVEQIEWDDALEEMSREKATADASRELKSRFKVKSEQLKKRDKIASSTRHGYVKQDASYIQAPPLVPPDPQRDQMAEMEEFLDELLS